PLRSSIGACSASREASWRTRSSSSASPARAARPSATRTHCSTVERSPSIAKASAACRTPLSERCCRARQNAIQYVSRARAAASRGKDAQREGWVGEGGGPEPAGMAEGGRVGLPPRANRLARVVALERLVHGLDVCGPRAERLDLSEQGPYHHRTSVIEASSV